MENVDNIEDLKKALLSDDEYVFLYKKRRLCFFDSFSWT